MNLGDVHFLGLEEAEGRVLRKVKAAAAARIGGCRFGLLGTASFGGSLVWSRTDASGEIGG